jgi:7,8-dihydroneopterin aldolase/epimerase/oxygenase
MVTIHLNNLKFFAYHGVHEEEAIVGGEFEVNIDVSFTQVDTIKNLDDTINYVALYSLVKKRFSTPEKLLETLAQNIAEDIYEADNNIQKINISIQKLNAPILNFTGSVGITYSKSFA